jgi:hypothetical protein
MVIRSVTLGEMRTWRACGPRRLAADNRASRCLNREADGISGGRVRRHDGSDGVRHRLSRSDPVAARCYAWIARQVHARSASGYARAWPTFPRPVAGHRARGGPAAASRAKWVSTAT